VKEYAMKQWAIMFRNWRSEMNTKWAKKGLDRTKWYKIMAEQWAVFLEQRREPEFLARSEANTELAKKNKYHHLAQVVTNARFPSGVKKRLPRKRQGCQRCLSNLEK
jgi:hypothetical protein